MITISASTTAAQLQAIVDDAPAGTTILLGSGGFTFDRTIVINRDNVTVKGMGSDATTINLTGNARSGGAFQVGSKIDVPTYTGEFALSEGASEGAKHLHLNDASGLKPGDHLWLELENTDAYLDSIGDTAWREDKPLRTSLVEITAVNGNTVQLANGVAFDFSAATSVQRIEVAENVRLGGFTVDSGLAEQDPGSFTNVNTAFDRSNVILLSATSHVKLFDIAIDNAPSNGFTFAQSAFVTASNLSVDGAVNKGGGGNGYAFQLRALYDSDLVGLEAYDTRHGVLFASWTSEANNYVQVRHTNRDVNFHGGPDHHNVVEVLSSIRTGVEANYLSPTLFVNSEGTSYGAPTDMTSNVVTFREVVGTTMSETITGDDSGVRFYGGAGDDTLIGGAGDDWLYGQDGDDRLFGGSGNDVLYGGAGADTFVFSAGHDTVADFSLSEGDRVDISPTQFDTPYEFFSTFREAATSDGDTFDSLGLDIYGSGDRVEIKVDDGHGGVLAMGLNGATLESLLASSDWIV